MSAPTWFLITINVAGHLTNPTYISLISGWEYFYQNQTADNCKISRIR